MSVADHLSRAYLKNQDDQPHDEFQVFALELEEINPLEAVKITSERLAQLQKSTEQDPVMQTLKSAVLVGTSRKISHYTTAYSSGASASLFHVH